MSKIFIYSDYCLTYRMGDAGVWDLKEVSDEQLKIWTDAIREFEKVQYEMELVLNTKTET